MKTLGLIGKKLSHSFSKGYFANKFKELNLEGQFEYKNFELDNINEVKTLLANPQLIGFNVTIPYKEEIMPFLDEISIEAQSIGAVNTVKKTAKGQWVGYNTDVIGFDKALQEKIQAIGNFNLQKALILGTGGAAKAVAWVLKNLNIDFQIVSRTKHITTLTYEELDKEILQSVQLIINTTPLGMAANIAYYPNLNYTELGQQHLLYDLIYNPEQTLFLKKGTMAGAYTLNGYKMLIEQAEAAWEIWQTN